MVTWQDLGADSHTPVCSRLKMGFVGLPHLCLGGSRETALKNQQFFSNYIKGSAGRTFRKDEKSCIIVPQWEIVMNTVADLLLFFLSALGFGFVHVVQCG